MWPHLGIEQMLSILLCYVERLRHWEGYGLGIFTREYDYLKMKHSNFFQLERKKNPTI